MKNTLNIVLNVLKMDEASYLLFLCVFDEENNKFASKVVVM